MKMMQKLFAGAGAAMVLAGAFALAPAQAQTNPELAAARANGSVGEQTDGYVGIVGDATPALRTMVNNINIRRRAVYSEKAREQRSTVEAYATSSGCILIARTKPGEKYQAPDGSWKTRTSAAPERLPICP